jgi:hypothetical protein
MSSILWILAALLIAVIGCLVNIVILIRRVDDVTILLSGMKAHCFGRKAGSDKRFVKSLHRINQRVRDLNKD